MTTRPVSALVRDVSPRLARAELTFAPRRPIDVDLARRQHGAYVAALAGLDVEVVRLPDLPDLPDAVFVEDTAVVVDDLAVLTRPGAASRRPEVAGTAAALRRHGWPTAAVTGPATLDGGDVLRVDGTVFVGLSSRTNTSGVDQLGRLLARSGLRVVPVRVDGALHLKSAATALPDGTVVAVPSQVDTSAFAGREVVAAPEPAGANVLVVGDTAIVSAAAPRTAELVASRGIEVVTVDVSELEKAEAGPTCLSVLLPPAPRPARAGGRSAD